MPTANRLLQILAWLLLVALAIVTIGPIGWRPETGLSPQIERAAALFVIGLVFGLAYPRHVVLVALLLITSTALFEVLQVLEPSRHGRVVDLAVKLVGAGIGLAVGTGLDRLRIRTAGTPPPR
jgi:hypothetical protein